ncbi:MAG: SPOR domain-containing protein [Candidatus Neomarinimicrobiota bacterium]|jgi:cell division septation protein DedD|nr:SPOR domain-containing protein [Candidatus Neomarinimicrobiota bacterium]MDD3966783.1 SPOR domain-containing protein [Candidatus Neomarinimicrobiota bacterium]MDX9779598.1 SPOR domain-containing protein [bacterium]
MNKSIKLLTMSLIFLLAAGCTSRQNVFVGDKVDIEDYKRPSNILKYQWSFDTKPPTSRLDPRDFIPSNYHPNVTFIPDVRGLYVVRLTMVNDEGNVIYKHFDFKAEAQPDYLAHIEQEAAEKAEKPAEKVAEKSESPKTQSVAEVLPPKIVEVPKVYEKVIHNKTTVTKMPNAWQIAPKPGEDPSEVKQEPAYYIVDSSMTKLVEGDKTTTPTTVKTTVTAATVKTQKPPVSPAVPLSSGYTVQIASSPSEIPSREFCEKLKAEGYDAFIQTANVNGVLYYRIRIGRYPSYQEAKAVLDKLIQKAEYRKLQPWIDKIG